VNPPLQRAQSAHTAANGRLPSRATLELAICTGQAFATTTMTTLKIDLKQREHLASFLEQAKREEKERLEEQDGGSRRSVINTLGNEKGAAQFVSKDAELTKKIRELEDARRHNENELEALGFDFEDGDFSLRWDAPKELAKEVERRFLEAQSPIKESLKKYDLAIAKIWIAVSGEEMQKAVEGLI